MKLAIIDYGAGNIFSVQSAFERLGINPSIASDPEAIKTADFVVFPGVGNAESAMQQLKEKKLDLLIPELKQPVLGICLGMQLLCESSEEGGVRALNVFEGIPVKKLNTKLKTPHMGWNSLENTQGFLEGIGEDVYFVHSYYVPLCKYTMAETVYPEKFSAALQKDNFTACQFHPEKSGKIGEEILTRFLNPLKGDLKKY